MRRRSPCGALLAQPSPSPPARRSRSTGATTCSRSGASVSTSTAAERPRRQLVAESAEGLWAQGSAHRHHAVSDVIAGIHARLARLSAHLADLAVVRVLHALVHAGLAHRDARV